IARTGPGTPSFAVHDVWVNWLISFCGSSALTGIANTIPIIRRAQSFFGGTKPRASAGRFSSELTANPELLLPTNIDEPRVLKDRRVSNKHRHGRWGSGYAHL